MYVNLEILTLSSYLLWRILDNGAISQFWLLYYMPVQWKRQRLGGPF
jgi:hypothetical protein